MKYPELNQLPWEWIHDEAEWKRVIWSENLKTEMITLTGDDLVQTAAFKPTFYYDGYYMAQKNEDNVLVKVVNEEVPELGATVSEMQEAGYRFTAMVVMSVVEYEKRLKAKHEEGFAKATNASAMKGRGVKK